MLAEIEAGSKISSMDLVWLAGTQDPIVAHGVQQIAQDHFVDSLVTWLGGRRPTQGKMTIDREAYGRPFRRAD